MTLLLEYYPTVELEVFPDHIINEILSNLSLLDLLKICLLNKRIFNLLKPIIITHKKFLFEAVWQGPRLNNIFYHKIINHYNGKYKSNFIMEFYNHISPIIEQFLNVQNHSPIGLLNCFSPLDLHLLWSKEI